MSVDYDQLKALVKEAMFTGGGINEPSGPESVPHRMPAADSAGKEQDMGDPEANKLYDIALAAREATEQLVEALDDPIHDGAYEQAFKATTCLRRVLNDLEAAGAHPMPQQRVVAPPTYQQKYTGGTNAGDYTGGAGGFAMGDGFGVAEEGIRDTIKKFGAGVLSRGKQAQLTKQKGADIGTGAVLGGVEDAERQILIQVEEVLTGLADKADLVRYRSTLKTFLEQFIKKVTSGLEPDQSKEQS